MRQWVFILFFVWPLCLIAQDVHFSQWFNNPIFQSPALAGEFDGTHRISVQQRQQWASVSVPFRSFSASFDMPYKNWGLGAQFLRDQSGSSRLSLTQLSLSLSRFLNDWQVGTQLTFAQQAIDYSDLVFIDNTEQFTSLSANYFDLGFGVYRQLYIAGTEVMIGYTFFHLNSPNRSLSSAKDLLKPKHQVVSLIELPLHPKWHIHPHIQWLQQAQQQTFSTGSVVSYDISDQYEQNILLEGGVLFRFNDALCCLLGVQWGQSHFAFSYDINTSDLVPASNYLGAWEISFSHVVKSSLPRSSYKTCPAFL
ncbi:MAG: PorP/SprF family type IX secretion system membrane protein [Bacteroidota bacterium]|nr:PorP/SprF family type IX secretion system membrane protein [Bacteroidota bacterium]